MHRTHQSPLLLILPKPGGKVWWGRMLAEDSRLTSMCNVRHDLSYRLTAFRSITTPQIEQHACQTL